MTRRALPRVVLLSAIGPTKLSLLRGGWRSGQLAEFLAAADAQNLRFSGFRTTPEGQDGRAEVKLVFDHWDQAFLRHAWPVLQDLDGSFAVAVSTAGMGQRPRHLFAEGPPVPPWSDLRRLTSLGVDVVSRGHEGYELSRLPSEVIYGELLRSRCEIERRLGFVPRAIRYVCGQVDDRVAAVARDAGFEIGIAPRGSIPDDPMRTGVLRPRPFESPRQFARRVAKADESTTTSDPRVLEARG